MISASGAASWASRLQFSSERRGTSGASSATLMGPTQARPCSQSWPAIDAAMPSASATKAPGTAGKRLRAKSSTSAPPPTASEVGFHSWMRANSDQTIWKGSPLTATPAIKGACLMTIVSASPKAKPRRTGREMKSARPPRRAMPAIRKATPVKMTRPKASASFWVSSAPGKEATAAARIAADEEVGAVMAKRLRPAMA